ncbi:hypothetical protein HJG60_017039 [Phyllostomus discolor]|uniref:Septin-type G domain-containing protein n=1 Tax=Phyllostomus discolor TaxID=89673 RepID=A0A834ELT9_9CHIR|nr:hypothetical protein HJG60_017039 [Phyllostomus discolor]
MSELVPEPRPKPAVPMKPVSINSNLLGYIGIDTIIEQMRKKTMKTGFDFNIMVVGQSGLGKSTLVNTLFKSQVSRKASSWSQPVCRAKELIKSFFCPRKPMPATRTHLQGKWHCSLSTCMSYFWLSLKGQGSHFSACQIR